MYNYPYPRPGLFSRFAGLAKGFSFSSFLDGAQKTLGVINQAIPIVYQVKPMFRNARTMFRIADELKNSDTLETVKVDNNVQSSTLNNTNKPIFYI